MEAHPLPASAQPPAGRSLPARVQHARDERLARLVAEGSERAFRALYDRHAQALYRYCRSIVGNEADAQDALQSTFVAALVALRRGARDAPVRPWLFRIAHNESISLLRRRRPTVELSQAPDPGAPSAAEQAFERDRLQLLVSDLRELGDRQRGALVMRELSGLSHEEIAVALGVSAGAAKQAIFEARGALAELAEGRAMPCDDIRRMLSDGDRRVLRGRRVRAHLRSCASCSAYAAAIGDRRDALQALAPPLAPVALAGVLAHVAGVGASGQGAAGAGAVAVGTVGKSAAAAVATKVLVGAALVTGTAIGVNQVVHSGHTPHRAVRHAPAAGNASGLPASGHVAPAVRSTPVPAGSATGALSGAGAARRHVAGVHAHRRGKAVSHGHGRSVPAGRGHKGSGVRSLGTGRALGRNGTRPAKPSGARTRTPEPAGKARGVTGKQPREAATTAEPRGHEGAARRLSKQEPLAAGSAAESGSP
jgi:RNA polymerase sigma factor (sigma-70 family)